MTDFLVILKPDSVRRKLVGLILTRFEKLGYHIKGMKMDVPPKEFIEQHYAHLIDYPEFSKIVDFMTSGPLIAVVMNGSISKARALIGSTDPGSARPGTIRGDLANCIRENLIHCSDSSENAQRELDIWFG